MAVTRERFEQGMTFEEYKAQMTRNRDRFEENEQTVTFSDKDIRFFKQLPQTVHVLVLTEDWCGDAIANVPVLGRLAAATGKLNLRLFLRDQNTDLMDQYLKDGQHRSIPVFVFFDEDFRQLGYWIERPAIVNQRQSEMLEELYAHDPAMQGVTSGMSPAEMPDEARARLGQAFSDFRTQIRDAANSAVVQEIRELIGRDPGSATQEGT
jgi:hypothetical protein